MSRANLPQSIIGRQSLHGVMIAELDHPDGVICLHSGAQPLTIDGTEYLGAGGLLQIADVNDASITGDSHTWTIGLSRATEMLGIHAVDDSLRDRGVRVRVSVSDDGMDWETPITVKIGRVSTVVIDADGIALSCVTATFDLSRVRQRHTLWTYESQRQFVEASDISFKDVEAIREIEISWP